MTRPRRNVLTLSRSLIVVLAISGTLPWVLGYCAGQLACPSVAAAPSPPAGPSCSTTCPEGRVCSGNACLYPCSTDADCAATGDPRIPVCSPTGVCVAGDAQ